MMRVKAAPPEVVDADASARDLECPVCAGPLLPLDAARFDRMLATLRATLDDPSVECFACDNLACRVFVALTPAVVSRFVRLRVGRARRLRSR